MRIDAVSIFPEYLAALDLSLVGKARKGGLLDLRVHDLRDWTHDRHRTVDDTPYGGGAGMVMRPEPWGEALDAIVPAAPTSPPRLIVPTPAGRPFDQAVAYELASEPWLVFACGRYEGIDARVAEQAATRMRVDEISIGDYVLNGGEVAVLVIVEAVARLLPGVIGNPDSLAEESHTAGLLEYPVYTKPPAWRGYDVPAVLLSGDHGAIARWRQQESVRRTAERRPDLLARWASGGAEGAVRFEPAAEQDAGELVTLRLATGADGTAATVGDQIAELAGRIGEGGVWKAVAGGRIVGAVATRDSGRQVEWLVVVPDREDDGVAALLLAAVDRAHGRKPRRRR